MIMKLYKDQKKRILPLLLFVAAFAAALNINASAGDRAGYLGSNACKPWNRFKKT
jgi:hypothetical protein